MYTIREVVGDVVPPVVQNLQGKILVNTLLKEVIVEGEVKFSYKQVVFSEGVGRDTMAKVVEEVHLKEIERYSLRMLPSIASTLSGVAIDYDEAIIMDTDLEYSGVRTKLEEVLLELEH